MVRLDPGTLPTTILHHLADGSCKTISELVSCLALSHRQVSDGAAKLAARKYLIRMERGCYQLSDAGLAAATAGEVITSGPKGPDTASVRKPVQNTYRERAWRSMRIRRAFSIGDVAADAATGDQAGIDNARRYIRNLIAAGYVAELPRRQAGTRLTSPGSKQYRLLKDTGPRAPVYRPKRDAVHDYNTGEDVPCKSR